MAYFEDYTPDRIKMNIVPSEGIYEVKVTDVTQGTMPKDQKRYTQVKCVINCEGYPYISIFLTEGPSFNGNLTAFYDTFSIERGNRNPQSWINHKGHIKITLSQKNGYTNMTPHFLINEDGYVTKQQTAAAPQNQQQPVQQSYSDNGLPEDIPF